MDMAWHCRFCIGIAEFGYYFFLRGLSFSSEIAFDGAPCSRQHHRFKFHCHSETECHCSNEIPRRRRSGLQVQAGQVAPRLADIPQKKAFLGVF